MVTRPPTISCWDLNPGLFSLEADVFLTALMRGSVHERLLRIGPPVYTMMGSSLKEIRHANRNVYCSVMMGEGSTQII